MGAFEDQREGFRAGYGGGLPDYSKSAFYQVGYQHGQEAHESAWTFTTPQPKQEDAGPLSRPYTPPSTPPSENDGPMALVAFIWYLGVCPTIVIARGPSNFVESLIGVFILSWVVLPIVFLLLPKD